ENGHDCNGEPANLAIYEWPADDLQAEPEIHTSGFGDVVLDRDRAAFTFAVVPEGTEVPRPDSVATLDNLSDLPGATPSVPQATTGTSTLEVPVPTDSSATGASTPPDGASPNSVPTDDSAPAAPPAP